MKKIQLFLLMALTCLAALPALATPEAEFVKLHKSYTLNPDGSQELRVYKALTVYTHPAMNSMYGETFIVYDPAYQELKIHDSYTRQVDGTIIRTPENAFVEVLPSAAAGAPAYNRLKEMVVVHTGLELGATLYLDYSVITRPGGLPALDLMEQVEELSPIRDYQLTITVPENASLHHELLNGKTRASVKKSAGMQTVTYRLKNVKPRPRSLAVSPEAGNVQTIVASTFGSQAAALDILKKQLPSGNETVLTALARKVTKGQTDSRRKAGMIADYVNGLGSCRLNFMQTGYQIRPVEEILKSAYCTVTEKQVLTASLMKAAGLESGLRFVFVKTSDPAAAGYAALRNILAEGLETSEYQSSANLSSYLNITDIQGTAVQLHPSKDVSLNKNTTLKLKFSDMKEMAGGYYAYTLPSVRGSWLSDVYAGTTANTTRPVNLLLPYLADETLVNVLETGDLFEAVVLPEERKIDNAAGTVKVTVTENDGKITVTRTLRLKEQLITPKLYPQYYRLMSEWNASATAPLVFKED